jgi:hypothetical protein
VHIDSKDTDPNEPALTALTQALEQITRENQQHSWTEKQVTRGKVAARPPVVEQNSDPAITGRRQTFGKSRIWSLVGLLVVAGVIGIIVFAWPMIDARTANPRPVPLEDSPIRSASLQSKIGSEAQTDMSGERRAASPTVETIKAAEGMRPSSPSAQKLVQRAEQPALIPAEVARSFQVLERRAMDLEHSIEQIRASQSELIRENSEISLQLKESHEKSARQATELVRDLEEKATQDRQRVTDQIRASQDQLAKISEQLKLTQEQVVRLSAPQQAVRSAPPKPQSEALAPPRRATAAIAPTGAPKPVSATASKPVPKRATSAPVDVSTPPR